MLAKLRAASGKSFEVLAGNYALVNGAGEIDRLRASIEEASACNLHRFRCTDNGFIVTVISRTVATAMTTSACAGAKPAALIVMR